jgi:diguanylate cyclase (GGDEF)-like protein
MKDFRRGRRVGLGSFIVDGRETILGFDEAMEQLTGWPAIDVVGRGKHLAEDGARAAYPGASPAKTIALYDGNLPGAGGLGPLVLTLNCRDGRWLEVEALRQPLNGPGDRLLVTVLRVLASSGSTPNLPGMAGRDPLTGLLDRAAFDSRLAAAFASAVVTARPLSLIRIDVDHMRQLNDVAGRAAGDDVLQRLAGILRVTVEDEPCIARLGDDDFAVLLEDGGRGEARQVAASLRSQVERFRFFADLPGEPPRVTITLGTASFPADADDARELYQRAGDALDEARALGRNRVWCYVRRPRVPVQVPVYFDGSDAALLGYMRDLSPSGIFLQTTAGIDVGMRCALTFPLPGQGNPVHVVGRVVRTVPPTIDDEGGDVRIPGVGVEFERFSAASDRRAIDAFLHGREATSLRPETGILSVD